ncbi:hypothetical protein Mgra_00007593, partial [Meloidogyne graminicola]
LFTDTIGFLLFSNVIHITIKNKTLHTVCHILLALYSLSQCCAKTLLLIPYILVIIQKTLPLNVCTLIYLIPTMLSRGTFSFILPIGIDRMFGICFPFWYSKKKSKLYWILMIFTPFFYPIYLAYLILQDITKNLPSECLTNYFNPITTIVDYFCIFSTFCCYLIILLKVICEKKQISQSLSKVIVKSLATIILIQICGWLVCISFINYSNNYIKDPDQQNKWLSCATIFASIVTIVEVIALFITSSEHLTALKIEFAWLLRIFKKI